MSKLSSNVVTSPPYHFSDELSVPSPLLGIKSSTLLMARSLEQEGPVAQLIWGCGWDRWNAISLLERWWVSLKSLSYNSNFKSRKSAGRLHEFSRPFFFRHVKSIGWKLWTQLGVKVRLALHSQTKRSRDLPNWGDYSVSFAGKLRLRVSLHLYANWGQASK